MTFAKPVVLAADADAYTYSESVTTNYGNDTLLAIKGTSTGTNSRHTFLKFDMSSLTGASYAKFRV